MRNFLQRARVRLLAGRVRWLAARLRCRSPRELPAGGFRTLVIGAYGNGNYGDDLIGLAIAETIWAAGGGRVALATRGDQIDWLEDAVGSATVTGGGLSSIRRVARLPGADVVILGGGGLLEGKPDSVHVHRLVLEYLAKLGTAGLRASRVIIHGIGISRVGYSDPVVTRAVREMLAAVDSVSVRDPASFAFAKAAGSRVALVRDPATTVLGRWATETRRQPDTLGVVLIDRDRWPTFTPVSPEAEGQRDARLRKLAARLVREAEAGARIRLIPFHFSDPPVLADLAARFAEASGPASALQIVPYEGRTAPEQFRELMSCASVVTGRFHPGLAAFIAGAEVEVIGELQKLIELRGYVASGGGRWLFPPEFGDPDAVLRASLGR